jgi:hypothetical protein
LKISYAPPKVKAFDTYTVAMPAKVADSFYHSTEWRSLMTEIIAERGRRCEDCGRTGCRVFGDHIREIKDGGAKLDKRNIRLRCGSCHTIKTNKVRRERDAARHDEEPNVEGRNRNPRADTRGSQTGLLHDGGGLYGSGDSEGSQDFDAMLKEALSGRAKKRK